MFVVVILPSKEDTELCSLKKAVVDPVFRYSVCQSCHWKSQKKKKLVWEKRMKWEWEKHLNHRSLVLACSTILKNSDTGVDLIYSTFQSRVCVWGLLPTDRRVQRKPGVLWCLFPQIVYVFNISCGQNRETFQWKPSSWPVCCEGGNDFSVMEFVSRNLFQRKCI